MYNPLKTFFRIGVGIGLVGLLLEGRYLWLYINGVGGSHIQSVILGFILIIVSVQVIAMGFLADLIDANRKRTEELLYKMRKKEYGQRREF
jgi:hypothetical protein